VSQLKRNDVCPLCRSLKVEFFVEIQKDPKRLYFLCKECEIVFLDSALHFALADEKARYLSHQNDPRDQRYKEYLQKMIQPLLDAKSLLGSRILDYGCGPTRGIEEIWGNQFLIDSYDPIFFPNLNDKESQYDFIICSEAAEHFYYPNEDWDRMARLIKPGGKVLLRTGLRPILASDFRDWYYHRDPTHICFYSNETVAWIEQNYSIKIVFFQ
jgi:SAM-dependent methyltransferase